MSVVKVNIMSELDALALMPFKRLFMQRKNHYYQEATSDYTNKLRQLYRSNLERRYRSSTKTKRQEKCRADSAIFRLDCNAAGSQTLKQLNGITIERSSFPNADPGDRVVLIKLTGADNEAAPTDQPTGASSSSQVVVGRGLIQAVSSTEIKIKLLEPLLLDTQVGTKSDTETKEDDTSRQEITEAQVTADTRPENAAKKSNGVESSEIAASTEATSDRDGEPEKEVSSADPTKADDGRTRESIGDDEQNGSEAAKADKPANDRPVIDFKIMFDTSARSETQAPTAMMPKIHGQYSELIEKVLHRFSKFKCDSAIHKHLLGFYDERADFVHDKARVMTFSGLGVKLRSQQRVAIEQSIKRSMSLIEGPAGSGKTLVAAYIAGNMSRLKRSKVLVCSPIQATVDKLAQLIDNIDGVQVVKLPSDSQIKARRASAPSSRSSTSTDTSRGALAGASSFIEPAGVPTGNCHLDKLVDDEIYSQAWNRSKDTLRNHRESLRLHANRMVTSCSQQRRRELEARILSRADVVCCTNHQAGSYLLDGIEFSALILDDVQVTSEIDCLVPMITRGIKQVTLLSDTRRRVRLARSLRKSTQSFQKSNGTPPAKAQATNSNSSSPTSTSKLPNGTEEIQQCDISNENGDNSTRRTRSSTETKTTPATSQIGQRGQSNQSTLIRRKRYGKTGKVSAVSQASLKTSDPLGPSTSAISSFSSTNEPSLVPGGLFERLLSIGLPSVDFRIQFRLHETLSNFTNHHFYLGRLKDDPNTNEKLKQEIESSLLIDEKRFDWLPNRKFLTAIFQVGVPPSSSSQSRPENNCKLSPLKPMIDKLDELITKLVHNEDIQESRIGVIFNRKFDKDVNSLLGVTTQIKKGTIGNFIGQQRDFIILVGLPSQAVVDSESNDDQLVHLSICSEVPCDFKHDDSALNCALTRARLGMFLITNTITDEDPEQGTNINNSATGQGEPQISPIKSPACRGWIDVVNYYVESGLSVQC